MCSASSRFENRFFRNFIGPAKITCCAPLDDFLDIGMSRAIFSGIITAIDDTKAHMNRCLAVLLGLTLAAPLEGFAQSYTPIEEIVVTSAQTENRVGPQSLVLDFEALQETQPVAVADVFRNISGISLRTNSRGDSVVRIRGAEERQTLIFLDGAPLATPWDGRADLALLPAGLIDRVEVKRGVVPIEYGANAVAGAVDLSTRVPGKGGTVNAQIQQGSLGLTNLSAIGGIGLDNGWSFVAGASRIDRNAERIAEKSSIAFDPSSDRSRTNTDLAGNSSYLAAAYSGKTFLVRASLLHADVDRGVAAQGDLDPAVANPRFWRTPEWRLTQATLNSVWDINEQLGLRFTGWQQWFDQTIDSYSDYSYSDLDERETGEDDTQGVRLALSYSFDAVTLRLISTLQDSTHINQEFSNDSGAAADLVADPALRYRQRLTTLGAEADFRLSDTLTSTLGIARDRASTPLTGDKPVQPSLSATGWSAGLRWTPSDDWETAVTLGQRSRFPTPREMYGAALGRFLINPELRPEQSLLLDLSIRRHVSDSLSLDVALWGNDSDETLSQRSVQVNGENRRQRYNTNGSFTYGIEAATTIYMTNNLRAEISAAFQDGRVERDENGDRPELLQRPESQVHAALDWQANARVDLRGEVIYTGKAYDIDDDGALVRLPDATSLNFRGFFELAEWRGHRIQLTASVDNATDALIVPQLGLPAAGRLYRIGLRLN